MKNQFSTAEGRREYWNQVRRGAAEQRERERILGIRRAKAKAKDDYLNDAGCAIYRARDLKVIGPEPRFPDARFERLRGRFRGWSFRVSSGIAGAAMEMSWDMADSDGQLKLSLADGRVWSFIFYANQTDLGEYQAGQSVRDLELARIACRLATEGSPFATITFLDPNWRKIREEVWDEYVALHPELADLD